MGHMDIFFVLNNVKRRFEKKLCIGTSLSTKDRVEFKTVMVSALLEFIF